jgi:2-keto-4-pentenoate hydratase/2-oxohepta-3-ene-1,7-dioic acid hydratase in catechol pathway
MKLVSFNSGQIGLVTDGGVVDLTDLSELPPGMWPPVHMVRLIAAFDRSAVLERAAARAPIPLSAIQLDAPVRWPNKVVAFPANYRAHIEEAKAQGQLISRKAASGQGFFLKANSSLSGPRDPILVPNVQGREVHHEMELGIIIGKRGRGISASDAPKHIFGFTCLLDMVVRGKEERVMRKSFDTFCPIGPWIVTADEVADWTDISLSLYVNGELRQRATTRDLIVDIGRMVEMASSVMTLEPGDVIASGTPAGVAPVIAGDLVKIAIDGVGSMTLNVEADPRGDDPVWHAGEKDGAI